MALKCLLLALLVGLPSSQQRSPPAPIPYRAGPPEEGKCVCRDTPLDMTFVVDSSTSISRSDFTQALWFVSDVIDEFDISPSSTRVALVFYGEGVYEENAFSFDRYSDKLSMKKAIKKIKHMEGTRTDTGLGIKYAQDNFLPAARPDVTKIGIVVTDGNSQDGAYTAQQAASIRDAGMEMFAVGIGFNISSEELRNIAGSDSNVFRADTFDMLKSQISRLVSEVCRTSPDDPTCYDLPLDISLVVDASSSIGTSNFTIGMDFLKGLVSSFDVSKRRTHFSLITYGRGTYDNTAFDFDSYSDEVSVTNALANTPYAQGDYTDTGRGIAYMRDKQMLPKQRPDSAHIAIVLTDGKSQEWQRTNSEAKKSRRKGISMYAIGVGNDPSEQELRKIAGDKGRVFMVDDYRALETIKDDLDIKICETVVAELRARN